MNINVIVELCGLALSDFNETYLFPWISEIRCKLIPTCARISDSRSASAKSDHFPSDVNECEAKEEPCASSSDRCVNVHGGYICCGGDRDDAECVKGK